jgi:AraC family transcriptional activator of pobA
VNKKLPVYDLKAFDESKHGAAFYCNQLNAHVKKHAFTNLPHKHDFYLVMFVTEGSGWHEIDFVKYKVRPGSVFMMQPGQMHYWKLSDNIKGYVFFHSKSFYNEGYINTGVQDFEFFRSFQSAAHIQLSKENLLKLIPHTEEMWREYKSPNKFVFEKVHALISLIYIELSRNYTKGQKKKTPRYLQKLSEFEELIGKNFKEIRSANEYANKMNISEKHLNRISRECLNKTSTQLITDRIILEAKRLLIQGKLNVNEIADELGYTDTSYFVRLFKKNNGDTPLGFLKKQKEGNY